MKELMIQYEYTKTINDAKYLKTNQKTQTSIKIYENMVSNLTTAPKPYALFTILIFCGYMPNTKNYGKFLDRVD